MKLLPYDHFVIETLVPLEQVILALKNAVWDEASSYKSYRYHWAQFTYNDEEQKDFNNKFIFYRLLPYMRGGKLIITGQYKSLLNTTTINIRIRLPYFAIVFCSIWFGFIFLVQLFILYQSIRSNTLDIKTFIPTIMILLGYLIIVPYLREINKIRQFLSKAFKGQIKEM